MSSSPCDGGVVSCEVGSCSPIAVGSMSVAVISGAPPGVCCFVAVRRVTGFFVAPAFLPGFFPAVALFFAIGLLALRAAIFFGIVAGPLRAAGFLAAGPLGLRVLPLVAE